MTAVSIPRDVTGDAADRSAIPGYLAEPVGAGPWPGVVVVHDIFGMTDDLREHTDRLAAAGYLAVLPDLYAAGGGGPRCVVRTVRASLTGSGPGFAEVAAAGRWLAGRPDCTGRVGVVGFCLGGGFALMAAPRGDFAAAAVNYGAVPADAATALAGACPVVASFGGADRAMRGYADRLERALTALGVPHDVKEYPGAGHGFCNRHPYGPAAPLLRTAGVGYDHAAAADAWRRVLAFFAEHLRAPAA